MDPKRVFAGFYTRYDGKPIFVVRVLKDYADLFRKRFSEGLSIRKAADAMQQNRGVIERRQTALYRAFAQLLQQRDEADGVCRLMQKTEYDQRDIEDLLE